MARVFEFDDAKRAEWRAWLSGRPQVIQEMAASHPPHLLYRLKSTGQRVTLLSYGEDRKCRVLVSGEYNLVAHERQVFGISIDDLEECDLPTPGEPLGSVLSDEELDAALAGEATKEGRMEAVKRAAMAKGRP